MAIKHWTWPPLATILAVGLALSLLAYKFAVDVDTERARGVLELRAEWRAKDFAHKVENAAVRPLSAVAAFIASQNSPDNAAFQRLAAQARDPDDPIVAILWAPRVTDTMRAAFERTPPARGVESLAIIERDSDGGIVPAERRAEYFPVVMRASHEDVDRLLGLDLLFEPRRRAAAQRARDEGRPSATPMIFLAGDRIPGPGYLVFWPVYDGPTPETVDARRAQLRGFVAGVFRVRGVLAAAIENTPTLVETIRFDLGHIDQSTGPSHVATYDAIHDVVAPFALDYALSASTGIEIERAFTTLDQHWRLVSSFPQHVLDEQRSINGWLVLIVGLALTVLVAGYAYRERAQVVAIEKVVEKRTADLQRANRELERLIDASFLAIIVLDPAHNVLVWNRAAERMFGYRADEVIGKPYSLVPDQVQGEFETVFQRVAAGATVREVEVRRRHKDGRLIDVHLSGAPLYNADGTLRGAFVSMEDVTERKATQRQLVQAQKMEVVGQLTGGIAHDFNNMLGAMIDNLDLAREYLKDRPDVLEIVEDALASALRGAELVDRLLAFARKQPLQPSIIDLRKKIADLLPLLNRTLGEHIAVETHASEKVWRTRADPVQFENALFNLVINARDAMPDGGRLSIECGNLVLDDAFATAYPDLQPGAYVVVSVSDTGSGMSPDVVARVFEPFFTTKRTGKGTGLGLSMVYGYMKQSGGGVKVYSEPGHGTTFRLFFPRAAEAEGRSLPAEIPTVPRGRERILIVEDHPEVRKAVAGILASLGYELALAESADEAQALLEREPFDLLFTDVVMPGSLNGLDLARRVRETHPQMCVLLTSGFSSKIASDTEIRALGAALLVKPYRKADLAQAVRAMLDGGFPDHPHAAAG